MPVTVGRGTGTPASPAPPGRVPARHALRRPAAGLAAPRRRRGRLVRRPGRMAAVARRRHRPTTPDAVDLHRSYPFYGHGSPGRHRHAAAAAQRVHDLPARRHGADATSLQSLLARWSAAAAVLQQGKPVGAVQPDSERARRRRDTGEAFGLSPASLTVTIGLGPALFDGRFGLAPASRPLFADLPTLNGDTLDPKFTGGELSVQACADDPQVCYHAVRNLARSAAASSSPVLGGAGFRPRVRRTRPADTRETCWASRTEPATSTTDEQYCEVRLDRRTRDQPWMDGGTYQVVRKIRMLLETWDTDRIGNQQQIIGRHKQEGAPLTGAERVRHPRTSPRRTPTGEPVIDPLSHVALAARENNGGVMIRRRGYNYTDGLDPNGQLERRPAVHLVSERPAELRPPAEPARAPTTCSTSTSATSARRSSRSRPPPSRATTSAQALFT